MVKGILIQGLDQFQDYQSKIIGLHFLSAFPQPVDEFTS